MFVCCVEEHQWKAFVELMGNPEWADLDIFANRLDRGRNWDALKLFLQEWAREQSVAELYEAAQRRRIPFAPVSTMGDLLERAEPYYHGLRERVVNGLAMFDERNVPGNYETIHRALAVAQPDESPLFRVVDEETREASLRPVKAGAIIINLTDRRIVQLQNGYREIKRTGRGNVWDGERMTDATFTYRLPKEWSLVPSERS